MKVRKITNSSKVLLPIQLKGGLSVFLPTGECLENVEVENYEQVKPYTKSEVDLAEVKPAVKGKQKLNG